VTRTRRTLLGLVAVALAIPMLVWGVRLYRFHSTHVSTDNAYVRADIAQVTARIPGTVVAPIVHEHWQVAAGEPLVRLDPAEYEVRLRRAEAALARALEGVRQQRAAVYSAQSQVRLADAELAQAHIDYGRAEQLAQSDVAPAERRDRTRTALRAAEARLEAARREEERARAALGIALDADPLEASAVHEALAARDEAALLLSYTEIQAPLTGVVAKRAIEVGQRVEPGQPLLWIVPLDKVYVEANFKETQLAHVRVGQPATIVADLYPDYVYQGHVESLAPGSGAAFALLPPENASGNWVKVVQRVPVRIALDEPPPPNRPLRVSLSVTTSIDIRHENGALLTPLGQARAGAR